MFINIIRFLVPNERTDSYKTIQGEDKKEVDASFLKLLLSLRVVSKAFHEVVSNAEFLLPIVASNIHRIHASMLVQTKDTADKLSMPLSLRIRYCSDDERAPLVSRTLFLPSLNEVDRLKQLANCDNSYELFRHSANIVYQDGATERERLTQIIGKASNAKGMILSKMRHPLCFFLNLFVMAFCLYLITTQRNSAIRELLTGGVLMEFLFLNMTVFRTLSRDSTGIGLSEYLYATKKSTERQPPVLFWRNPTDSRNDNDLTLTFNEQRMALAAGALPPAA